MKMGFLPYENGLSSDGNYISSCLWQRAIPDLLRRLDKKTDFLSRKLRRSKGQTANSSELRNFSSEIPFHSSGLLLQTSEEISILHGAIWKLLRGDWLLAGVEHRISSHTLSRLYKVSLPASDSGLTQSESLFVSPILLTSLPEQQLQQSKSESQAVVVEIRQVDGCKELKKLVEFNPEPYKNNPYHVPSIIRDEMDLLDKDKSPSLDICEVAYFLAYKDGRIIGRIAGIISHKANETWNQNYARFGSAGFVNDDEVVDKLFETVEQWGHNKGVDHIHGPMSFTDMDQETMLMKGFGQTGTIVGLYGYTYYPRQLERLSYAKSTDWKEYLIKILEEIPEKYQHITNLVKGKYGFKVVKYKSRKEIMSYAEEVFNTFNKAYVPPYGFSELLPVQVECYTKAYLPLLRLSFFTAIVREHDRQVIAFAITMPNLSKTMRAARGRLYSFDFTSLLNMLKTPPKMVDLCLIGVLSECRSKGINALIFADLIPICNKLDIETAESDLEPETDAAVQLQWSYFECKHHKTRCVFVKEL